MSPAATLEDVLAEVRRLRKALAERPAGRMLRARAAAAYLGTSRASFYRLVARGLLPDAVRTDVGRRWDVKQLDKYADACAKRRRRRPKPVTEATT